MYKNCCNSSTVNVEMFVKPFELKLKVCTLITSWLFDLRTTVVIYRVKITKIKKGSHVIMNRVIGVKMCSYAQTHRLMLGTNVVVEDFFKDFVTVQYTHLMTLEKKVWVYSFLWPHSAKMYILTHSRNLMLACFNYSETSFNVCLRSLSCWTHPTVSKF